MTEKREKYIETQIRKQTERKLLPNFYVRITNIDIPKQYQKMYSNIISRMQGFRKVYGYLSSDGIMRKDTVTRYTLQEL